MDNGSVCLFHQKNMTNSITRHTYTILKLDHRHPKILSINKSINASNEIY